MNKKLSDYVIFYICVTYMHICVCIRARIRVLLYDIPKKNRYKTRVYQRENENHDLVLIEIAASCVTRVHLYMCVYVGVCVCVARIDHISQVNKNYIDIISTSSQVIFYLKNRKDVLRQINVTNFILTSH